jgi:RNA polymerase sigma-70 factor, ECF subfamily
MKVPARDNTPPMAQANAGLPGRMTGAMVRSALTPAEFSAQLQRARGTLWLIAAGVLGRRNDADDVLQEAAMIGLAKIADFEPGSSFQAWMGGIVRNVARNHARKAARRQTSPTDPLAIDQRSAHAPLPAPAPPSVLALEDGGHFDDRLLDALQRLDETARACLLLRTLHEMPYREIALWLGVPEGTAMSHVHRARHVLRRLLSQESGEGGPR